MLLPIACSYTLCTFCGLIGFLGLYCQALLSSELLVVAKLLPLHLYAEMLSFFGVVFWTDKFFFCLISLNFTNEECAREREQRQMTSTTNRRERAAAATATRVLHQPPPPPHPFPHLALQQPQRHSGDPFVQPAMAGPSHISNPQPPNPSPRDQVADIRAQLAAIQQQQPLPARQRLQSTVQTASGVNVNNVPIGAAGIAYMHAQADALRQQLPQSAVQPTSGINNIPLSATIAHMHPQAALRQQQLQSAIQSPSGVNNIPLGTAGVAQLHAQADALRQQQTPRPDPVLQQPQPAPILQLQPQHPPPPQQFQPPHPAPLHIQQQ
ncbi:hypothetical protein K439DRAFT_1617265 [Ramaria rubella]|nr:hypothetical protein K439DRAFT_1617265 [Ramaria rubella]